MTPSRRLPTLESAVALATFVATFVAAVACLAGAAPVLAQSTDPGEIFVWQSGYKPSTSDIYLVNFTSSPITLHTEGFSFINGGDWRSATIDPWATVGWTGIDTNFTNSSDYMAFYLDGCGSGGATCGFDIDNKPEKGQTLWQLTDESTAPGAWTFAAHGSPKTDARSGACAYTSDSTAAIYNDRYAVVMTQQFATDGKNATTSKLVVFVSEIVPAASGQPSYQACGTFNDSK